MPVNSPGENSENAQDRNTTRRLRILATTDIHAHLLPFDYIRDHDSTGSGLAGIAPLISKARQEAKKQGAVAILLDNGDLLQGSAIADTMAALPVDKTHPLVACMNHLRYDAVGIGNHDFDYGINYLRDIAGAISAPAICSNLGGVELGTIQTNALLVRQFPSTGESIKIGIISLLPQLARVWNAQHLGPAAQILPLRETARRRASALKKLGADVVIALAHMGIGEDSKADGAMALADLPEIDAIIAGHTHRRLPSNDYVDRSNVDALTGTVSKRPAIMPGFAGSDLGVMDLALERANDGQWRVASHGSELKPNTAATSRTINRLCDPAHQKTRARLSEPVGETNQHLHSYFSMLQPSALTRMVAEAKARIVWRQLAGSDQAKLPLLASVASRASGGREGPTGFLHIPPGQVLRRHVLGLAPHANQIVAAQVSVADLLHWLEHAASHFDGQGDSLVCKTLPGFHHDSIYGLETEIDLTRPIGQRIRQVHHQGRKLAASAEFIIATHSFRVAGGGGYRPLGKSQIIKLCADDLRDEISAGFEQSQTSLLGVASPWRFTPMGGRELIFETSPDAKNHLDEIANFAPRILGETPQGFLKLALRM